MGQNLNFNMHWLTDTTVVDQGAAIPLRTTVERKDYPLPPNIGAGWYEQVMLAPGVTIFRSVNHWQPEAAGRMLELSECQMTLPEAMFVVQTIRGGTACHHEFVPKADLTFKPGIDFFRHADRMRFKALIDTSSDSEMTGASISVAMLDELLGDELASQLLARLGLSPAPVVKVAAIPLHVSAPLRAGMSSAFSGNLRKLYAQSKVLEYLCLLAAYVTDEPKPTLRLTRKRDAAHQLHDELSQLEGKLPTLDQLAAEYGISAKSLNDQFVLEYGQSIYAYITECRLREAHAALQESDVPMKVLSARLGYSHVNNFIRAFTRTFGFSPGNLRRRAD